MRHDLEALAEHTVRVWLRAQRSLRSPFQPPVSPEDRADLAEEARELRTRVQRRDWWGVLDRLGSFGSPPFSFLEAAFPLLSPDERAECLQYVWCRAQGGVRRNARALRLFRAATRLRRTVPKEWPLTVVVYRGAVRQDWPRARRAAREGIAWTTNRTVAAGFAEPSSLPWTNPIGCLATATVPRRKILAYFKPPEPVEVGGRVFKVEGYREHECILDHASITSATYELVKAKASPR